MPMSILKMIAFKSFLINNTVILQRWLIILVSESSSSFVFTLLVVFQESYPAWFKDDQEQLINKGLIQFVVISLRNDKVHESASGINFKSKHLDILQSPWLIELIGSVLTLTLLGSEKLDCSLICPICLDIVFQPYALGCGHIFCKSCACLAAHVLIIEGLMNASPESKCPVCRESGVYDKSVCMSELGLLLQQRCKQEFKERLIEERKIILKQTKEYWELQTSYAMGL